MLRVRVPLSLTFGDSGGKKFLGEEWGGKEIENFSRIVVRMIPTSEKNQGIIHTEDQAAAAAERRN